MKKIIISAGLVVLLLFLGLVGIFFAAFKDLALSVNGQDLGAKVRLIKDGNVNFYVLDLGGGEVALVDAGHDGQARALQADLKRRGFSLDSVRAVFLTHGHPDHIAACSLLTHADIYALEGEADLLEGRAKSQAPVTRLFPAKAVDFKIHKYLKDGESVKLNGTVVRAFAVPGHTAGSAAYLADGVLFLGDAANAGKDGRLKPAPRIFTDNPKQAIASLKMLAQRLAPEATKIEWLAFGHSAPLKGAGALLNFKGK